MNKKEDFQQKILVVDDDQHSLNLFKVILKKNGFFVETTTNANNVLEILKTANYEFDLLITDILMKEMSGVKLIDKIRELGIEIPIIAVTGFSEKDTIVELLRLGCDDYIEKPIDEKEFVNRVKKTISNYFANKKKNYKENFL